MLKNHFIATTALVATAGVASADITLSGMGRIGVVVSETAAVAAEAAVAGGLSAAELETLVTELDVADEAAAVAALNDQFGADTFALVDGVVATTTANMGTVQAARAEAAAALAAATAAQDVDADALAALAQDVADIDALIAALSGTAAVAAAAKTSTSSVDTRIQFDIAGSGSADSGLTFGGKIRLRSTSGNGSINGAQVMIGYGDLTVYGGNIPGVLESMPHAYANTVGYSGGTFRATVNQADTMAYSSTGTGANALQANFSMGAVSVAVAHQPSNDNNQASVVYSANGLTVALGGQFSNRADEDETVASIGYAMGNYSFNVSTSDNDGNRKTSFGGAVDAGNGLRLNAYVTENESEADNAYGFGVKYDLGGATFGAAYETGHDKADRIEAGLTFSF